MCRSPQPLNFLHEHPETHNLVANEDDFMRKQRLSFGDLDVMHAVFMEPLWKIQSAFKDAMNTMEQSLTRADKLAEHLNVLNKYALGDEEADDFDTSYERKTSQILIAEYAFAADLYLRFIQRMTKCFHQARILYQSFESHRAAMLELFIKYTHPSSLDAEIYDNKIQLVIQISLALIQVTKGTIRSGNSTLKFTLNNLKNISKYHYEFKIPFPSDPLCGNFLYFHWHQIDKEMIADNETK